MSKSVFHSEEKRDCFRAYYRRILSAFPIEQKWIPTTLGDTFCLAAGLEHAPPMILLHGSCSNSIFWSSEMARLSASYRVYAPDLPGEAGLSSEFRPDLDSDQYALWLKEVLSGLDLEKTVLMGNSLGGWVALKYAVTCPDRVSALILLSSSGLWEANSGSLSPEEGGKEHPQDPTPPSELLSGASLPPEVLDFIRLILESYVPVDQVPVFSDAELKILRMPVLFLGGAQDPLINVSASAERLSRLVPQTRVEILPDQGHLIGDPLRYVLPFLGAQNKA